MFFFAFFEQREGEKKMTTNEVILNEHTHRRVWHTPLEDQSQRPRREKKKIFGDKKQRKRKRSVLLRFRWNGKSRFKTRLITLPKKRRRSLHFTYDVCVC